ncbi:MAG: DNA-directed RNA polymerase subunit beta [Clostridia bacterium]|jgi:DNA-directed RNA polymerase subunit beta|nr:DNA-directed RNA polymerase subunit beta [Clostridia bacterium]
MNLPIQKFGKTERRKFGSIDEVIEIPNLVEIQRDSYASFIGEGISEIFEDYSPISDFSDHFELYFLEHEFGKTPKYDEKECRNRDATYALPLRVKVRLVNKVKDEILEQDVFMGDFPLMTENGSFIINGAERVIVSQLVRSPGVNNVAETDKTGKQIYETTVIPNRGAWLEFKQDSQGILWVSVDRKRKLTATVLLRALGYGSARALEELFGGDKMIAATIEKDEKDSQPIKSESDGLIALYRRLRPGEVPTEDSVRQHLYNLFFDTRRYDVVKVGRYKFNKKLNLAYRLPGCRVADDVIHPETGEILAVKGEVVSEEKAREIQNAGIGEIFVLVNDPVDGEIRHKIISNKTVDFCAVSDKNPKAFGLLKTIYYPNFVFSKQIAKECETLSVEEVAEKYLDEINNVYHTREVAPEADEKQEEKKNREKRRDNRLKFVEACVEFHKLLARKEETKSGKAVDLKMENAVLGITPEEKKKIKPLVEKLNHKCITIDDIVAAVSTNLDLQYGIGTVDEIDHLGNRRVRSVGELLQNQLRIGMSRLERLIKERMATADPMEVTPSSLINVRPISAVIREFFGSSQLSQFMDQINPIAELTHKRKLSALGPGGLNRDRATFEVRDVHYSHYGRMCPIETPEGQNIGLISSLATFSKVNEFGFIMSPYRKVDKEKGVVTDHVDYLTADEEDRYVVAQANEPLDQDGHFVNERVGCRYKELIIEMPRERIDYMDVSPKQLVSVATALIPFLENDDTNRALMGSNMQRQAVPLLKTESSIVATGIEAAIARDSGVIVRAKEAGVAVGVSSDKIVIKEDSGFETEYPLKKFERSNQGTCLNQRPIISTGDRVEKGEVIADGPSTNNGELALGKNILVGFMEWEGYNYEDAILISEKLVQDDVFTSIHIEEHETEARDTKLGEEEITRDIPNVGDDALKDLDEDGIVRIGAEVSSGDILVGKVTPKGETELTPEERLLRAIFGEKSREVRDTSLRVPHGEDGIVVDVKIFTRENKDELSPGVNKLVRVYVAQKRKIQVGDKMAGRHGNKGVISRVLPQSDMPFLPDGTPLQILLNPLGVPSRMNIGQVLEVHLGYVCRQLGWKIATPVFDGATESDIEKLFEENNLFNPEGKVDGKFQVFDGRTGEPFENRVTIGIMYMIKLCHLVDDKIHARSIGPYSMVTQQPLGGKAQFGGQRFGEMEVWALEAYGAAHILQEILTVKSDDIVGRVKTYESIVKGNNISEPGIPEAFKVLLKELQSLALDVKVLTENNEELIIREFEDDDKETPKREEPVMDEEPDFDFGIEEEEDDEDIGSIFDEAGDDEDFASSDLFADKDLEEDDMSDIDEDGSFGNLFDEDDSSDGE